MKKSSNLLTTIVAQFTDSSNHYSINSISALYIEHTMKQIALNRNNDMRN